MYALINQRTGLLVKRYTTKRGAERGLQARMRRDQTRASRVAPAHWNRFVMPFYEVKSV
jgi:hypothetical protein